MKLFTGTILPFERSALDEVEAMAVEDGKVVAVGAAAELRAQYPTAPETALDGWVMPGLIEAHGHPAGATLLLSPLVVDLRPVEVPTADEVMRILKRAIAAAADSPPAAGIVYANGWDALLQRGLPELDREVLDRLAGDVPVIIVHNSGHSAYFNSAAAHAAGINRDAQDPAGASFVHTADGELAGVALEAGAVQVLLAPLQRVAAERMPELFSSHLSDLARRGITTVADLSWQPELNPLVSALHTAGDLPVRLRWYDMSRPNGIVQDRAVTADRSSEIAPWFRQVGVKTWSDGSPWIGNIATSFPYLDTEATRSLGLEPGHVGHANYTAAELEAIAEPYAAAGWQLACHVHGDLAIESTLDVYEKLIARHGLTDHRFRLDHCGAMKPAQYARAAELGVTVSVFVDHITYWGEVLVNDLFGSEHGGAWADAGAAFMAGHRATFHNDGWVTPNEPFRNMAVAENRTSRSGFQMPGGTPVTREQALFAQTVNAAWQLFSEEEVGSLATGRFADFIVVDRDPRTVSSEALADTVVLQTYVGGRRIAQG